MQVKKFNLNFFLVMLVVSKFMMNVKSLEMTLMSMMLGSLKPVMITCHKGRGMCSWQRCTSPCTGRTACLSKGIHLPRPGNHHDDEEEKVEEDNEDDHDKIIHSVQKIAFAPKNANLVPKRLDFVTNQCEPFYPLT